MRHITFLDRVIQPLDHVLALVFQKKEIAQRPSPGFTAPEPALTPSEIRHVIGLMRVNHAGEVAAQGLYQGQALTAKTKDIGQHMEHAAQEEIDHLAWCRERLEELGGRTSFLDPLWFLGAVLIGAGFGAVSDRFSLGFIAETERQVSDHLAGHLHQVPPQDQKTRRILAQMQSDEEHHEKNARALGGPPLPYCLKKAMQWTAKIMVKTAYYL